MFNNAWKVSNHYPNLYSCQKQLFFFLQTVRNEGFLALYKGFIPTWLRMGPWNIIFFLTYEQMKQMY